MQNSTGGDEMGEVFRPPKSDLVILLAMLPLFLAALVVNAVLGITTPPPAQAWAIPVMGGFVFGGMVLLTMYGIASWWRSRLVVNESGVVEYDVFTRKEIVFAQVTDATWSEMMSPHGSLVMRTPNAKLRVVFGGFGYENALRLIRIFHRALPADVQKHWPVYCLRHALPLQKMTSHAHRVPGPDEVCETRSRWNVICSVFTLLSCAAAAFIWWADVPGFWIAPFVPLPFWILFYFMTPRKGHISKGISAFPEMMRLILTMALVSVGIFLILTLLERVNADRPLSLLILSLSGAVAVGYAMYRGERARRRREAATAPQAVSEWEKLEQREEFAGR